MKTIEQIAKLRAEGPICEVRAQGGQLQGAPHPAEGSDGFLDGDLFTARFRFLSADTDLAGHHMRSPSADALKAAAPLWGGVLVRADHTRSIQALAGRTLSAEWADGDPGGIEGDIELDAKLNPIVARGVQRGLLGAVSTVMSVAWEQSHLELSADDFWAQIGEDVDGETVTRVMTRVLSVAGVDVVDFGADPHAQRLQAQPGAELPPSEDDEMRDHLLASLELDADTDDEAIKAKLAEALAAPALLALSQGEVATLTAQLSEAQATIREHSNPIPAALEDGRITPVQAEALQPIWAAAPDSLVEYLDALQPGAGVPLGKITGDEPPAATYTEAQLGAADKLGIPVERLAKEQDRLAARRAARK